jgi:hypothetical protein
MLNPDRYGLESRDPLDPGGSPAQPRSRFLIINLDEIEIGDDPVWLIDGLLPASGFGIVFGPPKSGKSFLVTDALFNVALGRSWAGRETKQGAVVYITGEGVTGFKRRLVAIRRHYCVEGKGVPFGMIPVAPNFGHVTDDAAELVALVREWLASVGDPPLAAIVIDTLARAMKGADENAAKDMSVFVDNCGILGDAFGCLVLGVHHAGKNTDRGARGSNALDAAVDVMWSVEKGAAASTAAIYHMKDGEDGAVWQFRLAPFIIEEGTDTRSALTSCVVEIVTPPDEARAAQQAQQARNKQRIGDRPALLLRAIDRALSEAGGFLKGSATVPHDVRSIAREDLKRYLPLEGYWDQDRPSNVHRATYSADLKTLKMRGYIGLTDGHVWRLS